MRLLVSTLAVGILALGVLTACNSAEQSARNSSGPPVPAAAPQFADGVRRVTVTELQALVAKNQAFIIDVRNQTAYDAGHVRGSRLIPEVEVGNHFAEMPKDKLIVTYCS